MKRMILKERKKFGSRKKFQYFKKRKSFFLFPCKNVTKYFYIFFCFRTNVFKVFETKTCIFLRRLGGGGRPPPPPPHPALVAWESVSEAKSLRKCLSTINKSINLCLNPNPQCLAMSKHNPHSFVQTFWIFK